MTYANGQYPGPGVRGRHISPNVFPPGGPTPRAKVGCGFKLAAAAVLVLAVLAVAAKVGGLW